MINIIVIIIIIIIIIIIMIITCYNFETVVCRGLLKLSLRVCPNSKTFDSIIIILITMMINILIIIASIIIIIIRHFHISRRRAGWRVHLLIKPFLTLGGAVCIYQGFYSGPLSSGFQHRNPKKNHLASLFLLYQCQGFPPGFSCQLGIHILIERLVFFVNFWTI